MSAIDILKSEEVKIDEVLSKTLSEGMRQARIAVQGRYTGLDSVLRALSTTGSGTGAEFVPTGISQDLINEFRQDLIVSSLFRHVTMPTKVYELPVSGAPGIAFHVAENTGNTGQVAVPATTPGTAKVTFTAKDLATLVFISNDETQDSIIPMIPFIQGNMLRSISDGIENAILNGDTTGTHMDTDTEAAGDTAVATAWKGLRKHALENGYKVDISSFSLSALRAMRKKMGKFGSSTHNLAWIVSNSAYNQMLSLAEVETVDKFGSAATVVNGVLERLDGIPVFISPHMREDLDATGVNGANGNTKTGILLVHRDAFLVGDRQSVEIRQEAGPIENRQQKLVADIRMDFQPAWKIDSNPTVVFGYNLAS